MAKQQSKQAAPCNPQAEFDKAFEALINSTEPNDILGFFDHCQCVKNHKPAPAKKDRLNLDKWQDWIENAPAEERRAWAIDAINFAQWLMMHKTRREKKNTMHFPVGLEDVGLLITYIEGHKIPLQHKIFYDQNKFFMATENNGVFAAEIEREQDIGDKPNFTTNIMRMIPSRIVDSTGETPTFDQAIKDSHATWVRHREEYGGHHPLAGSVEAWVLRPTEIEPFRPFRRGLLASFDKIEMKEAKRLIQIQAEPPLDTQLYLNFPELQRMGDASWLLDLYEKVGGAANQRGRGAPWEMRLFIGGLLQVPLDQRDGHWHCFTLPTDEVIRWLYPDGWPNKKSRWKSFPKALERVNHLGWVYVPGAGKVRVFEASIIPEKPTDPIVEFIARVPPSAAHGARIDWPKLCDYGKQSAPLYRAYLTACEFMHRSARNGQPVTEVIGKALQNPNGTPVRKKGKKGGKGKIIRSKTQFEPNPAARYVKGLTKAELTAAIGLDATNRSNQKAAIKAFERLEADGVIDLQTKGHGQYQKYFLFAPNLWAQANAEVLLSQEMQTKVRAEQEQAACID